MRKAIRRILFYLLGLLTLALGLSLNTKTGLGVSPIISAPYCVSLFWEISFGDATLAAYCAFVAAQLLLQKGRNWLPTLLQLPLSLAFTRVLNLLGDLLTPRPATLAARLLLLLVAILCTGVGAALTLSMELVPNPGDGIVHALSAAARRPTGAVKNLFDLAMVALALLISAAMGKPFCGIGPGTLLGVLGVGRVIAWFDGKWGERTRRAAGVPLPN